MSDCTVNIADFRCRAIKFRASHTLLRSAPAQGGLALVSSRRRDERPRVYDIGLAREAEHTRRRVFFRPISIQRRAKVLRFHEAESPVHATMHAIPHWTPAVDGPYDLPPAA